MGWPDRRARLGRLRLAPVLLAIAVSAAGCFQPLYGDASLGGNASVRNAFAAVDVEQILAPAGYSEARIAVQIRNDLIFNFTGGGSPGSPTHRLKVQISPSRGVIATNQLTGLPNIENYTLNATYTLTELATGRVVVTGRANTTASYDPSGTQRFARVSALHDAERRNARVISDSITTRLASYFYSGS